MSDLNPIQRLTRDLAKAASTLSDDEVRFLVDNYYQMQDNRIRADGQIRSIERADSEEPHAVLSWLSDQSGDLENQIKRALGKYVDGHPVGPWMLGVYGIGPVISAGLLAHIDVNRAPTAGHIWRFAGLDPTSKWSKGQKRPWNARLKVLCWKAGESFVKFHKNENCTYGHIWLEVKKIYTERNEAGLYAERAAKILEEKSFNKSTDAYAAYKEGRLPPAHVHAMARRYAVKIFLSHLHGEMCRRVLGTEPPKPFALEHLGHAHMIHDPQRASN